MYGIIYKITNLVNGKIYIGQTIHSVYERYGGSIANTKNRHLKHAIDYYGVDAFSVDEPFDSADSKEELDEKEKYYIAFFKSNNKQYGYNLDSGGHNGTHSAETRKMIGDAQRGELNHMYGKYGKDNPRYSRVSGTCDHCGNPIEITQSDLKRSKFHYCSDDCRKASRKHIKLIPHNRVTVQCSNCGKEFETYPCKTKSRKHLYCSKECQNTHYQKIYTGKNNPNFGNHKVAGGNNGRARRVLCITTGEIFDCTVDANKKYGLNKGLIPACCRGEQKTAGGKQWKYI